MDLHVTSLTVGYPRTTYLVTLLPPVTAQAHAAATLTFA